MMNIDKIVEQVYYNGSELVQFLVEKEVIEIPYLVNYEDTISEHDYEVHEHDGEFYYVHGETISNQGYVSRLEAIKACIRDNFLDEIYYDIYEYHIVSGWLAEKLTEIGAGVIKSFSLNIWCRLETGTRLNNDSDLQVVKKQALSYALTCTNNRLCSLKSEVVRLEQRQEELTLASELVNN